jgi:hypothetical protein
LGENKKMLAKNISEAADVSDEIILIVNPVQKDFIKKECKEKKVGYSESVLPTIDEDKIPRLVIRIETDKELMKPTKDFVDFKRLN